MVSAEVAEQALRLALVYGPVGQGSCTRAASAILGQLPGFESINSTLFPNVLRDKVAKITGVELTEYRETDGDDKSVAATQIDAALKSGQ